ncbi:unnamed protein product [Miscanthus lutarioriparius]|uniref:RING-type domain-containing protein n=1 Tax=Miscanthus lutarioriparius TaxID=422564 RepID=A0A811QC47_9POAL|nr:unnamed protein product [Miscanthus lutarioriparius]
MPCAHRFHERCLTEWLALSCRCPCCRHALPSEGKAPPAVSSLAVATSTATTSAAEGGGAGATGGFQGRAREAATRRRSTRARQGNVRLFGPEWTADTSDDGLGLQQ